MEDKVRFLVYCKMTCIGGSEVGDCPCKCPNDCEFKNDPSYTTAREEAVRLSKLQNKSLN